MVLEYGTGSAVPSKQWSQVKQAHKQSVRMAQMLDLIQAENASIAKVYENIVTKVSSVEELKQVDRRLQADLSLNTMKAWETRLALRREASVRDVLHLWWMTFLRTLRPGLEEDELPMMGKAMYVRMYELIFRALASMEEEQYEETEARQCAEEDWASESACDTMSREVFLDSVFQLADLYTDTTSATEYAGFLRRLLELCVCKGASPDLSDGIFWVVRPMKKKKPEPKPVKPKEELPAPAEPGTQSKKEEEPEPPPPPPPAVPPRAAPPPSAPPPPKPPPPKYGRPPPAALPSTAAPPPVAPPPAGRPLTPPPPPAPAAPPPAGPPPPALPPPVPPPAVPPPPAPPPAAPPAKPPPAAPPPPKPPPKPPPAAPPPPKPPVEYGSLGRLPGADEVEVIFNPILLSRSPPSGESKMRWRITELPPLPGWGSRGSTPNKTSRTRQCPDESEQRNRPASRTSFTSAFAVWDLPSPGVSVSVAEESFGKDAISTGSSPRPQSPVCHAEGPSPHGQFYYRGEDIRLYMYPSRARERQEKRSAHKMRKAMVLIQSKARGLLAKAKYGAVRHALVQIQANARRLAARRFLANACSAALFIQLRFRALHRKVANRRGRPLPTASAPGTLQGTRRQNQAGTRRESRSPRRSQQQGPISLGALSAYMYNWESDFAGKPRAPARSLVSPGSSAASLCDSNRDADRGRPSTPRDPSAPLDASRWTRPQSGMGLPRPIVFEPVLQPHRKPAALSAAARRAAYSLGSLGSSWSWESDGAAWSVDTRLDRNASALLSTAAAGLMGQRMREVPSTPVSGSSSSLLRTPVQINHRPPMVIPDSAALKDGASERRSLIPPLPRSRTLRPVVDSPPVHVASRWPKKPPVLERHRTKLALQAATASVARSSSMPVLFLNEGACGQEWVELASAIAQSRPKLLRARVSGRLDP